MNIEEKAKRYAQSVVDEDTFLLCSGKDICDDHIEYASQCYTAGYIQAVTDLNVENEKLREALSLAYELISVSTEYEVEIPRYREGLLKINELLKLNS